MVSFTVRMKFNAEDRTEIADALRQLAAASRQEVGCITYIPHHTAEDPDTVVIYEQYIDEKALAAHRETEHFKRYAIGSLYQRMRDRAVENMIALA
jgi:quinol monooxygenase YgiN